MVLLCGLLEIVVVEAKRLLNIESGLFCRHPKNDPFCIVELDGTDGKYRLGKTSTIDDCLNPKWYHKLSRNISQDVKGINFFVKDKDMLSSGTIGRCFLPVETFCKGTAYEGNLNLTSPKGRPAGILAINVKFSGSSSDGGVKYYTETEFNSKNKSINKSLKSLKNSKYGHGILAFLHGTLDIYIDSAVNLPNLDNTVLSFQKKDVSDPFVVVNLKDDIGKNWKVATTKVIDNDVNPVWKEGFRVYVCHKVTKVTFVVHDKDFLSSEVIGSLSFASDDLISEKRLSGQFDLFRNKSGRKAGKIKLSIRFLSKKDEIELSVPECCFPSRENNKVYLYQDAHCNYLPLDVLTAYGDKVIPRRAWKDIYETIIGAKNFIYIVGWSVSAKVSLLRWEGEDSRTLGEILIQKANEGVQVKIIVWDELTSTDFYKSGAMDTEDEATADFFKGTNVQVILVPRNRHSKDISTKQHFTMLCYSHHQKTIIADATDYSGCGYLIAFIGGLDLTAGRFDTPEHHLFKTLHSEHSHDFYNKVCATSNRSGPRQPWHDIHCRLEGPIVLDVLTNFSQRWAKQGNNSSVISASNLSALNINIEHCFSQANSWNVQLFRSINSDSAYFKNEDAVGIYMKKGRAFENSIQRAYIHHIRRADNFIYIENQYFLGSSHEWLDAQDAKVQNLIPLELAAQIEEKICEGKRMSAYIIIPLFPEGKPDQLSTQEILHWQFRTIEMMYTRIGNAIAEACIDAHPQDYLLFLCLGSKEAYKDIPEDLVPPTDSMGAFAFRNRRHMIYVHSKMAIFDDEYIIVGSANINDRSMSGNRDTEIAIGAYQPSYIKSDIVTPSGDIYNFRRCLWAEHMGRHAPIDSDPASLDCIRRVKCLAEENLEDFLNSSSEKTHHHLLLYPLMVERTGKVGPHPRCQTIPDSTASVIGSRSKIIPTNLTT